VCINKADLNEEVAAAIEGWCVERGIGVVGSIPYDPGFTQAQVQGKSLVELRDGATAQAVRQVWREVGRALEGEW
jgi:MinD superfamily P-loop ATPase